jgi:arginyl-tRNA synthetase
MTSVIQELSALFGGAFEKAGFESRFGAVSVSARPDLCQFQCNGAMPAAKAKAMNPRQAAQAVLDLLKGDPRFKELSLAGPGFINISLSDTALASLVPQLALPQAAPRKKVLIDFGGPNVAKPMHVGHLRSSIIGDCLQRLHRAMGNEVVSDIHLGDWGTQMGMLILGLKEEGRESSFTLEDLERIYPAMSARCKADEALAEAARRATKDLQAGRSDYRALWRSFVDLSIKALKHDFSGLGVHFDLWLGESDSQAEIPAMLEDLEARGISQKSEGAVVIMCDPEGATEVPPLLLVKSDGGYLYGTTDLATLRERVRDQKAQRLIYVADKRQALHFKQVIQGGKKSGYLGRATAEHVGFGTVNGKDGKPFKTRDGGVMRLQALLAMAVEEAGKRMDEGEIAEDLSAEERSDIAHKVGYAAVKYADLSNHRSSDYAFDIEKFTQFEGKTGPYLLYAAVRMKSILRKAAERSQAAGPLLPPGDAERPLTLKLLAMPEALVRASDESLPHVLCEYAYELSGAFSTFYAGCNIINEADEAKRGSWLSLTSKTFETLEKILGILGMETPEKM